MDRAGSPCQDLVLIVCQRDVAQEAIAHLRSLGVTDLILRRGICEMSETDCRETASSRFGDGTVIFLESWKR